MTDLLSMIPPPPFPGCEWFVAIMGVVILHQAHAIIRHGMEAIAVREHIAQYGHDQLWEYPDNPRKIYVCRLCDGRYGIQVVTKEGGAWVEVTSFIKNRMKRLSQIENYLENRGARKVWERRIK